MKAAGIAIALEYMNEDPETNLPKLMEWVDRFTGDTSLFASQRATFRKVIAEKDNNWYHLLLSLWSDVDDGVRGTLFENLIINTWLVGASEQRAIREKYQCNAPFAIVLDPTTQCSWNCGDCHLASDEDAELDFDAMDDIVEQGKMMGVYLYFFLGGEPLSRRNDLVALCNKHSDCLFLAFTSGKGLDEELASDMLRVKNFLTALTLCGGREETDARRGPGAFDAAQTAMEILRRRKLPFGIACSYDRGNTELVGSEAFYDQMISWGAKICLFTTAMPVGTGSGPETLATAAQREYMFRQERLFRQSKPLMTVDFWNDGQLLKGCIAGGRSYLHINARGDIEPCVFVHFSDSNIHQKTLLEACTSPLFRAFHDRQPFDDNFLRSCPALDRPEILPELVKASGAHPTYLKGGESAEEFCRKCRASAEEWRETADRLWASRIPAPEL